MIAALCVLLIAQSVEVDKKIGAEAAKEVLEGRGLYESRELSQFLEKLGARLVEQLGPQPFTYRFAISDELEPNAYALPGGYVFATRTLFAVANAEEELAGVLGHEIIHAHRRHSMKAVKRSILPAVLAIPGSLTGMFSKEAGDVLSAPSNLMMAGYSRKTEAEADDKGVQLAAQAGYDPAALASFLERLTKIIEVFVGEKERRSFFDDHPATPARLAAIEKRASGLAPVDIAPILPDRGSYLKMLDGLIVGQNPEQGIFERNTFIHPDLNFRMELPEGWKTFNSPAVFGAAERKGKGQIVVGLAEGKDAESAGREAVARVTLETKQQPAEERRVDVNGNPGYYARFEDRKSNLHLLWVRMDAMVFRMVGIGDAAQREPLRKAAFSLRTLKPEERDKVRALRMRIESARGGETMEALCKRTRSHFQPAIVALLNDLDDRPLGQGQQVKIVRWEPYQTKR
jgi:predicted Zn-dependent protease